MDSGPSPYQSGADAPPSPRVRHLRTAPAAPVGEDRASSPARANKSWAQAEPASPRRVSIPKEQRRNSAPHWPTGRRPEDGRGQTTRQSPLPNSICQTRVLLNAARQADSTENSANPSEFGRRTNSATSGRRTSRASHVKYATAGALAPEGGSRPTSMHGQNSRDLVAIGEASRTMVETELQQLPIFANCSPDFLHKITEGVRSRSHHAEHVILQERSYGASLFIILRGAVRMLVDQRMVMRLTSGDYFGETMLFGIEQFWAATLRTEVPCVVCELPRDHFNRVLSSHPRERELFEAIFKNNQGFKMVGVKVFPCNLFMGLPDTVLNSIDEHLVLRLYFPSEKLQTEGDTTDDELHIVVHGKVAVEIAGRVVRVEELDATTMDADVRPALFGELKLLGMEQAHTTTVMAQSICHVRVLYRPLLMQVLESHRDSLQDNVLAQVFSKSHRNAVEEPPGGASVMAAFKDMGCSEPFVDFLKGHLEVRFFPSGQTIFDNSSGSTDSCMHMLVHGTATIVTGEEEKTIGCGEVFGGMEVLRAKQKKQLSKVVAAESCCSQVLHQTVVARGLELFPDQREIVLELDPAGKRRVGESRTLALDFVSAMKSSPLLGDVNPAFIEELANAAIDRIYMPGDMIIEEGTKGDSMFIMVSGQANIFSADVDSMHLHPRRAADIRVPEQVKTNFCPAVRKAEAKSATVKIGMLSSGSVCGELAMLGIAPARSASVQASEICFMMEVTQDRALATLDRFPEERDIFSAIITRNLDRTVPARILSLPLFRSFDRKFRILLTLHCTRLACFPEHHIVREGESGDRLFIVNLGPAVLQKRGLNVKLYSPGSYFGIENMLGIHKHYMGCLVPVTMCHVLCISRSSYLLALEQYPCSAAHKHLLHVQRAAAAELRDAVERTAVRRLIWQRYQAFLEDRFKGASKTKPSSLWAFSLQSGHGEASHTDHLRRILRAWREHSHRLIEQRRQREKNDTRTQASINEWLAKVEEGRRRVYHQQRIKQFIEHNAQNRGPLVYPDMGEAAEEHLRPESIAAVGRGGRGGADNGGGSKDGSPRPRDGPEAEIVALLKDWPTPRPSPHYSLRIHGVLEKALEGALPAVVLPPFGSPPNSSRDSVAATGGRSTSRTSAAADGPRAPPRRQADVAGVRQFDMTASSLGSSSTQDQRLRTAVQLNALPSYLLRPPPRMKPNMVFV